MGGLPSRGGGRKGRRTSIKRSLCGAAEKKGKSNSNQTRKTGRSSNRNAEELRGGNVAPAAGRRGKGESAGLGVKI